jgi:hypothetical protein
MSRLTNTSTRLITGWLLQKFMPIYFSLIEKHIIPHRTTIIKWGRALEDWLHLSPALRPICPMDPGLLNHDIRWIAIGFSLSFLFGCQAMLFALLDRSHPELLGFALFLGVVSLSWLVAL